MLLRRGASPPSFMLTVTNELAASSPIDEHSLKEIAKVFDNVSPEHGIKAFLGEVTSRPEAQGYKWVVTATEIGAAAPLRTVAGAHWNEQQDGSLVISLSDKLVVVVTWVKA